MENPPLSETKLILPGNMTYLQLALSFIEESASLYSLSRDEVLKIRLAAEEAVTNVITHSLENSMEKFSITCTCGLSQFEIAVREKGKPFSPENIPEYSLEKLKLDGNTDGLGTFMMKKVMDEIHYRNLGRDGKELVLIKYLGHDRIIMSPSPSSHEVIKPIAAECTVRDFSPADAQGIAECAYSVYAYGYMPYIYYPTKITEMNSQNKLISMIACDGGTVAAHLALKYDEGTVSAELGNGFVRPEYRQKGLFDRLCGTLMKKASDAANLKSVFTRCATTHDFSQKTAVKHGFTPCGLMLLSLPSEEREKESALAMCRSIKVQQVSTVYLPDKFCMIVTEILSCAGFPTVAGDPEKPSRFIESVITSSVTDVLNTADIFCKTIGSDTCAEIAQKLKSLCADRTDVIFLHLDMTNPAMPYVAEKCMDMGFIFCAVMPLGINGCHSLIMQYVNNVVIDFDSIRVTGESSDRIKEYVRMDSMGEIKGYTRLKENSVDLNVVIDSEKVDSTVREIVESDYFRELSAKIDRLKDE